MTEKVTKIKRDQQKFDNKCKNKENNKEIKKYSERGKEGDSEIAEYISSNRVWLEFVGSEPVFNLPMNQS